jgi:hypothetical protein
VESGKRVTSIFIAVALLALAALAISVNREQPATDDPDMSVLPGLSENLRSIEKLTGYPLVNIRSVRITRTNGDEVSLARADLKAGFQFTGNPPTATDKTAYSAILYANAAFLDSVGPSTDFSVVTDVTPEQQLGRLLYDGFDGVTLENSVFRARNATWLRIGASYDGKLRSDDARRRGKKLLSPEQAKELVLSVNSRLYQQADAPQP